MAVKFIWENSVLLASIEGDIDHHTAKGIRESIDYTVEDKNPKLLQLDFSKVQFMDSSGIGLVMGRYKLMKLLKGELEVVNMPPHIERLIKLSGLGSLGVIKKEGEKIATYK